MSDELGDRMKLYEMAEAGRCLMPLLPIMARIDGRCFSGFTRGMRRPYDERLSSLMQETARFLCEETGAVCGYTQSDEISLAWYSEDFKSQTLFGGRIQKLASVLSSLTATRFMGRLADFLPSEYARRMPHFDCRVWNVPNLVEAANTFLWREIDATKNSISMAAREHYSHRLLHGKGSSAMQELLFQAGVNWNDYPDFFKRGTFCIRRTSKRKFTAHEIDKLPERHDARKHPDLEVERQDYWIGSLPKLRTIVNRVDVLFSGAEPQLSS